MQLWKCHEFKLQFFFSGREYGSRNYYVPHMKAFVQNACVLDTAEYWELRYWICLCTIQDWYKQSKTPKLEDWRHFHPIDITHLQCGTILNSRPNSNNWMFHAATPQKATMGNYWVSHLKSSTQYFSAFSKPINITSQESNAKRRQVVRKNAFDIDKINTWHFSIFVGGNNRGDVKIGFLAS